MHRLRILATLATSLLLACGANAQARDMTDRDLAGLQGEYSGVLQVETGEAPFGVQLIALTERDGSRPQLHMVLHEGGLPGAGWQRGEPRHQCDAGLASGAGASFEVAGMKAVLADGALRFVDGAGAELGSLQRVVRQSPTLGAAPPAGAVVLFDGRSADSFEGGTLIEEEGHDGGLLGIGCDSKQAFQDHRIHLEFRTPFQPSARGQGRGNSGVYVQGRYECQVLDSFGLDGKDNECGGVYSIAAPIVNACLPPGQWQTYDIDFIAARYDGATKVREARMTVHLNGILVHDDLQLTHATTASPRQEGAAPGGLYLQDHGNPVRYRNVWVVERDPKKRRKVVFLAGGPSHGYGSHEHEAGCRLLAKALDASGLPIDTEVHLLWPGDETTLDTADVIVSFADGGGGHPLLRHLDVMARQMARGASLVCIHYAVEVPTGTPGAHFVDWLGGYFETHWSVNPMWTASFAALPEHPVARGVQPFAIRDEWYFHMRFRPDLESVTPILSAIAPASTMSREDGPHSGNPSVRAAVAAGEPQHVAWVRQRPDGGRAFGFTGAHVHWNWGHDDYRKVVLNAIAWCARLDVPAGGVPSTTPDLAALQANQSGAPGENFDTAQLQQLLDSFRR